MINIICVRTGSKYGVEYVQRLKSMVSRHLTVPHRFICLTDQPEQVDGVEMKRTDLPGWWAKMEIFRPSVREGRAIYLDLDTVIIDNIDALAAIRSPFAICRNFTRQVVPTYPCRYGSCVMVLGEAFGEGIWQQFIDSEAQMRRSCVYGDQQAIEILYPDADFLQDMLPPGFMVGRRDFTDERPQGAAVMIFAGKHKPHNTPHAWLKKEWT